MSETAGSHIEKAASRVARLAGDVGAAGAASTSPDRSKSPPAFGRGAQTNPAKADDARFSTTRLRARPRERSLVRIALVAWLFLVHANIGGRVSHAGNLEPEETAADTDTLRVMVLHSYHPGFPWTDSVQQGIMHALEQSLSPIEVKVEYLDAKRHTGRDLFALFEQLFARKYSRCQPDLIISCDDDALAFLFEHRDSLFPGVPVVFCGLDVDDYDPALLHRRRGYTGVVERLDLESTIDLILALHPNTQRILFVHDQTTGGRAHRSAVETLEPRYASRVDFAFPDKETGLNEEELLETLAQLGPDTIVYLLGFFRDRFDKPLPTEYIIPRISAASPVPVYAHAEPYFGQGIVGGKLLSGKVHGQSTGAKALRILQGQAVAQTPVSVESSNRYMFDYRQLERFGIGASALPPGTLIMFEPASFYERHRVAILAGGAAAMGLALVTILLLITVIRRARTERLLAASEARYRGLVEGCPDIVYVYSKERGALYWSQRVADVLGFQPDELLREPFRWVNAIHPDDQSKVNAAIARAEEGETFDLEYRIRDTHGQWHWFHDRPIRTYADGNDIIIEGLAGDITERKQNEERFRAAYAKLEALWSVTSLADADLKTISDHILATITEMTGSQYGFYGFVDADEQVMTIHAWSGDAMADCVMVDKPTDFQVCTAGVWAEAIRKRAPLLLNDYVASHPAKHGLPEGHVALCNLLVVPHVSHGRVRSVAAVANRTRPYGEEDIKQIESFLTGIQALAESKQAEAALARSEREKNLILNSTAEMFAYYDLDLRIRWANRASGASVGLPAEQLVGRHCYELWHQREEPCTDCPVLRARETKQQQEAELKTPDGRHWFLRGCPVLDENGELEGLIEFGQDITARRRLETERLRLEHEIEKTRRHESLANMAGAIAHQFNNILTAVLGNLDAALESQSTSGAARVSICEALKAAEKAAELSHLMLVYVGHGQDTHQPIDLGSVVADARGELERLATNGITMRFPQSGPLGLTTRGDRARLQEALVKLVSNAVEAIGDRPGTITIALEQVDCSAEQLVQSYIVEKPKPGRFVRLAVRDDGEGMTDETLQRLFEPYFTTRFTGRGLGLAAVLGTVRGHGGAIFVQSEPDKGTTIELLLPSVATG